MENAKDVIVMLQLSVIILTAFLTRSISADDAENNPRTKEALKNLEANIKKNGMFQPIIVGKFGDKKYVIDGHKRCIVASRLGMTEIPAIVREIDEKQAELLGITVNTERENPTPLELARTYQRVMDSGAFETDEALADALLKSKSYVSEILGILKMDARVLADIEKNGTIRDSRVLRDIRSCGKVDSHGKSDEQYALYKKIVAKRMKRSATRIQVREQKGEKKANGAPPLTITKSGKASLRFDASTITVDNRSKLEKAVNTLSAEKRTELDNAVISAIEDFLRKDNLAVAAPVAA